jgi:hypothetical protein
VVVVVVVGVGVVVVDVVPVSVAGTEASAAVGVGAGVVVGAITGATVGEDGCEVLDVVLVVPDIDGVDPGESTVGSVWVTVLPGAGVGFVAAVVVVGVVVVVAVVVVVVFVVGDLAAGCALVEASSTAFFVTAFFVGVTG